MKKYILFITVTILIGLTSCFKEEPVPPLHNPMEQLGKDTVIIRKFLTINNIDAIKLGSTGIYYKILAPGTGTVTPNRDSKIEVKYQGRFLNETVFDETKNESKIFTLGTLISGWQLGIPLIKKGGKIRLIVSSGYAYEEIGRGPIPPNTNLDYDIELVDVK